MSESRTGRRLAASGLLVALAGLATAPGAWGQSWQTLTSSRQLWGTEPVVVEVEYGAGQLEIQPIDSQSLLYRMELRYDEERMTPVAEFDSSSRTLRLGTRGREGANRRIREGSSAEIHLSDRVPIALGLHFGAGEAEIELGGLRLQSLDIETGASETTVRIGVPNPIRAQHVELQAGAAELHVIGLGNLRAERIGFQGGVGSTTLDFSGSWAGNASASLKMGVGELVLRLPRGLGVQINRSSFLTSFEADWFQRRSGSYFSDNWERASRRMTIDIEAALGSIEVEWIDG